MKTHFVHCICAMMLASIISCNRKVSQEELIQTAVSLKIELWRESKMNECRENAMAKAEAYVDSILVIYSLPSKLDTIGKPPKPNKPPKPFFRPKPDSVIVKKPGMLQ